MTQETTQEITQEMTQEMTQVRMPMERHLLNWTNQDTIDTIMMGEDEDQIQNYLRNAGTQELYGVAMMAARNAGDTRHITEAIVEQMVAGTREQLRPIARGDAAPPRLDARGLEDANQFRLSRNLLDASIREMTRQHPGGTRIRDLLLQASQEAQEAQESLDQALSAVLDEMTPQIDLLKSQMTRKVMDALEVQLQVGTDS